MKSRIVGREAGGTLAAASQSSRTDLTRLLTAWANGDASAADQLMPLVYDELHRAAVRAMRGEAVGHTLQPTALVSEVYLRFADQSRAKWQNRAQFFGVAAQVMRRVLVDHARARISEKRGGGEHPITLDEVRDASQPVEQSNGIDVLELHEALEKLAALDPKQARVVELRYFSGLTIEETAEALGISTATVKREWAFARAWLQRELRPT
jgi:RNA polymerase sigma-70 factor (ECF subfamily)